MLCQRVSMQRRRRAVGAGNLKAAATAHGLMLTDQAGNSIV